MARHASVVIILIKTSSSIDFCSWGFFLVSQFAVAVFNTFILLKYSQKRKSVEL